jgi:hypothetical protein
LGTDGRELPVEVFLTADARLDPVILAPGGRAAALVGWAGRKCHSIIVILSCNKAGPPSPPLGQRTTPQTEPDLLGKERNRLPAVANGVAAGPGGLGQ